MVRLARRRSIAPPSVASSSSTGQENSDSPSAQPPQGSPSVPAQENSAPTTKKAVRGRSRGLHLKATTRNAPLIVHIDPEKGRPVDCVQSVKLASELGQIARDSMPMPKKWKDLDDATLMMALDKLDMNLKVESLDDDETWDRLLLLLQNRLRAQRHNLHKHFKKFSSVQTAKDHRPEGATITDENWEILCDQFGDPKYQDKCQKNKVNRAKKKKKTNHNQGSRSFVVSRHLLTHEVNKQDPSRDKAEEVDRITFYKHCHYSESKGWTTPKDKEIWEEMERRRAQAIAEGREVDTWKIADDVLKKRSGYVAGLGYGPRPIKQAATTTTKMKRLESENAELKGELSDIRARMERQEALLERLLTLNNQTSLSVGQSSPSS